MNKKNSCHIQLAHFLWKTILKEEDIAIDCTLGNGHDTLFLASLPIQKVFSIDVQKVALEKSLDLLEKTLGIPGKEKVELYLLCHSKIDELSLLFKKPKLIVYNLGYLPGSDKTIKTKSDTTLMSLEKALSLLAPEGAISITCYPGHEEGKEEEQKVLDWAQKLSYHRFEVRHHRWINRQENAPSLLWIQSLCKDEKTS